MSDQTLQPTRSHRPRAKMKSARARYGYWSSHEAHAASIAFWNSLERFRYLIAALAVFAMAVVVYRIPATKNLWQRFTLVRDAESLVKTGRITSADLDLLAQACAKVPNRPEFLRALAIAAADNDPGLARRCYDRIVELRASEPADTVRRAALMVKFRDFNGARALLDQAPGEATGKGETLRVRLAVTRELGDFPAVIEALEALALQGASSISECLAAAEAAVKREADSETINRLESLCVDAFERNAATGRTGEFGSNAGRLTALPFEDANNRSRAIKVLSCLSSAPVEQRLALVLFSLTANGAGPQEVRRACLSEIHRGWGLTVLEKGRVAALLQRRHEHALVTEIITLPESLTEVALFRQRLDSLLRLGNWREAAAMVAESPNALPDKKHLLRCLAQIHQCTASSELMAALIRSAIKEESESGFTAACATLGCASLEMKRHDLAAEAFSAALAQPSIDAQVMDIILDAARRAGLGATATLRLLTAQSLPAHVNTALKTRLCYLRLLARLDIPVAENDLCSLAAQRSKDPYVRFLHAFNLYRRADFVEAGHCLVPLPQRDWYDGERAIAASIMAGAGQFQESSILMERLDPSQIFPEESAVVAPWLARMDAAQSALSVSMAKWIPTEQP